MQYISHTCNELIYDDNVLIYEFKLIVIFNLVCVRVIKSLKVFQKLLSETEQEMIS